MYNPRVPSLRPHGLQDGQGLLKYFMLPADHDGQCTIYSTLRPAAHRSIEEVRAVGCCILRQLAAYGRSNRTHINDDQSFTGTFKYTLWASHNLFHLH